jgi:hypothetical protein
MTITSSGFCGMSFDDMFLWLLLLLNDTAINAAVTALRTRALVMILCLVDRVRCCGVDDVPRDLAW